MNIHHTVDCVRTHLRIQHSYLDSDIRDTIRACLMDLEVCGIACPPTDDITGLDPLIKNAVKLFCKAAFTDDTVKAAAFTERYNALKASLMMASGYKGSTADE